MIQLRIYHFLALPLLGGLVAGVALPAIGQANTATATPTPTAVEITATPTLTPAPMLTPTSIHPAPTSSATAGSSLSVGTGSFSQMTPPPGVSVSARATLTSQQWQATWPGLNQAIAVAREDNGQRQLAQISMSGTATSVQELRYLWTVRDGTAGVEVVVHANGGTSGVQVSAHPSYVHVANNAFLHWETPMQSSAAAVRIARYYASQVGIQLDDNAAWQGNLSWQRTQFGLRPVWQVAFQTKDGAATFAFDAQTGALFAMQ